MKFQETSKTMEFQKKVTSNAMKNKGLSMKPNETKLKRKQQFINETK